MASRPSRTPNGYVDLNYLEIIGFYSTELLLMIPILIFFYSGVISGPNITLCSLVLLQTLLFPRLINCDLCSVKNKLFRPVKSLHLIKNCMVDYFTHELSGN